MNEKLEEIIKGLEWVKENQHTGVTNACDDLILKCEALQLTDQTKILREALEIIKKQSFITTSHYKIADEALEATKDIRK